MMDGLTSRDMEQHVPIIGWLFIVSHAIFLAIGAFVFLLLAGIGAFVDATNAAAILTMVALFVAALMALLALPGMIAGYGLLKKRSWARMLAIIISVLNLVNFPIGTIVGLYAMWVLFQQAASDYFGVTTHNAYS